MTLPIALLILVLAWALPASAESHAITWKDLLPEEEVHFNDPFEKLTEEQLHDLRMVARIRSLIENGKASPDGPSADEERRIIIRLHEQGIDVEWLFSQRERITEQRRERMESGGKGVNGSRIRIPGYMLPLESGPEGVTRFLLVPWMGACIHTPQPPPNQIIHVSVPGATASRTRFAPVWIEGAIRLEPGQHDLFLLDGTQSISVAYSMTTDSISEYSSAESDVLALVETPPEALAEQSLWERWQTRGSQIFTRTMTDIRDRTGSKSLLFGILIAFLYGIVHTLGPGHGKAVVVSYFVGEGGHLTRGVGMGVKIAVFHVLSAIAVVWVTDFTVRQATGAAPSDYRIVRLVSYAAITAIGGWMLWKAFWREKHSHHHGHEDDCGACAALQEKNTGMSNWLALAVGSVPCTGALLVLLFGIANDLLLPAILMVVAISFGMALTLSAIGILALAGRRTVSHRVAGDSRYRFERMARISAAALVFLIGVTLFFISATPYAVRLKGI